MPRGQSSGGSSNDKKKFRKNPGSTVRRPMLNIGQMVYFRNDLKEIMSFSDMEEGLRPSFMASLIAKASQRSIVEAREFITEVEQRGQFGPDTTRRLNRLLDHYTKYR